MKIKDLENWLGERESNREIQKSFGTRLLSKGVPVSDRKEERGERDPATMDQ